MTTYYLAPDGSDSDDGSEANPWRTIAHASDRASNGDTIVVQDGTYEYGSNGQVISTPGLTVRAADGAQPTMVWSGDVGGWSNQSSEGVRIESADGVTIEGLELTESRDWGLHVRSSSDVTVRGIDTHHNAGPGMGQTHSGPNHHYVGCDSHHNGVEGSTTGDGDGIIVNAYGSNDASGTVVEGCRTWANTDDGLDCWDASGVTVRDSESWDNGRTGSTSDGSGMGFKLGGGDYGRDNHIERCFAWENEYAGISDNYADGVSAWNCTAWNNSRNYEFNGSGCELVNCISYDGPSYVSGTDTRSNTWDLGISDPQFSSLDPDTEKFLCLTEDSPCVGAGEDVGLSYEGDAPDLGAVEWGGSTASDPEPTSALYYHDGSGWQQVSMRYHDGEQFA